METATIVYPISNGNYTDSNIEMIMSLRSLRSIQGADLRVFVISEKEPMYLSDEVSFIQCESYRHALELACTLDENFLWMNDDIAFINPVKWDDLKKWSRSKKEVSEEKITSIIQDGGSWAQRKGKVLRYLKNRSFPTFDYSTHLPYYYNSSKLLEVLGIKECDFGYKTPVETLYGNIVDPEIRECRKLSRHHKRLLPVDSSYYEVINYADSSDLHHIRGFLLGKFPDPSIYEDYGRLNTESLTLDQLK